MRIELFNDEHINGEDRIPHRPLGALSTFVVEELPQRLSDIRNGTSVGRLQREALLLATDAQRNIQAVLNGDLAYRDLAALDAKMLESAIIHSGGTIPNGLSGMVDILSSASGNLPALTYEDVILVNPIKDRRTFTAGPVGHSEADFYEGHRQIEQIMDTVVGHTVLSIKTLEDKGSHGIDKATEHVIEASGKFNAILGYMDAIGIHMNREHFAEFRTYFQTHPSRNIKGPSGAFSGTIPAVDILMAGTSLDSEHKKYIEDNFSYFPRASRREIMQAARIAGQRQSVHDLAISFENDSLYDAATEFSHNLRKFRGKHFRGVAHQIPGAIKGNTAGTGGETDVSTFLRKRINTKHI
jgi:hypothetical protein